MDENKKVSGGEVPSGFDEVLDVTKNPEGTFKPTPMFSGLNGAKNEGYAVTPEGGFYTNPPAEKSPTEESTEATSAEILPEKEETPAVLEATDNNIYSGATEALPAEDTAPKALDNPVTGEEKAETASSDHSSPVTPSVPDFIPSGTYSYSAPTVPVSEFLSQDEESFNLYSASNSDNTVTDPQPEYISPLTKKEQKAAAKEQKRAEKALKKEQKKKYGLGVLITAIILSIVLAAGGTFGGMWLYDKIFPKNPEEVKINKDSNVVQQEVTQIKVEDETVYSVVEAVAKKSGPSVVGIRTTAAVSNFFGGHSEAAEEGSGIIYTTDGYIITNYHVIQSAVESSNSKIEVFLNSDTATAINATVVGYNISSDLAVVKIEKTGLPAIELADSDSLTVGQYAIAIGNPGGLEFIGSVSCGVISGLNRSVTVGSGTTMSLIQTDAAINPGNSGGALVDSNGRLIGVNSVKLVSESFEGMGFAIPSNTVQEICDNIIKKQNEPTPYIGIQISQSYSTEDLLALGLPAGAVVLDVVEGGPAEESGIRSGDIITEFNGQVIKGYSDLDTAISNCSPGTSVTVKIYRAGRAYSTNINIEANNAG